MLTNKEKPGILQHLLHFYLNKDPNCIFVKVAKNWGKIYKLVTFG